MKLRSKYLTKAMAGATNRIAFLITACLLIAAGCSSPSPERADGQTTGRRLPRALIVTSGITDEEPRLSPGIVTAIQSLNKRGVTVRLAPRDIIYDYEMMSHYSIIILSTFPGVHDADRKYSLSYMSDEELVNLERYVGRGGVLIAGDNTGRNYPDGTDRITLYERLTPDNWELSKCFGVTMTERNIAGFHLSGEQPGSLEQDTSTLELQGIIQDLWVLVPDSTLSADNEILASMHRGHEKIPAILKNRYQEGTAYFLASSGFLQPVNEGGYWSIDRIDRFIEYIISDYEQLNGISCRLNPWPDGAGYAFSVSLNAEGNREQLERVFSILHKDGIIPTVFVHGTVDAGTRDFLLEQGLPLASSGYSFIHFNDLGFPVTIEDILRNERSWDMDFDGFRFPYTQPGFYGLMALEEYGYRFESSIGANNLDFIHGTVVPHNLVISKDGFSRRLDLLEIAPTYHDDYYFLGRIESDPNPDSLSLNKDIQIYGSYLKDFWEYAVKPYNGIMVFLGHPRYIGYSEETAAALSGLIKEVKQDQTWLASLEQVAEFRSSLEAMEFYCSPVAHGFSIRISAPENTRVNGVCIKVPGKVKHAKANQGDVKVTADSTGYMLVFEAFNGQSVMVDLE